MKLSTQLVFVIAPFDADPLESQTERFEKLALSIEMLAALRQDAIVSLTLFNLI